MLEGADKCGLLPVDEVDFGSMWTCPSCGTATSYLFCHKCGERRLFDEDLEESETLPIGLPTSWFGRLRTSLGELASPPGQLTASWVMGRRTPYLPPFTLFLWTNVVFFVVQSISGLRVLSWPLHAHLTQDLFSPFAARLLAIRRPGTGAAQSSYESVFNAVESVHAKSLVLLMVPVFALALRVIVADRKPRFSDCLSFALHLYSFALIWLCALFPLAAIGLRVFVWAGGHIKPEGADEIISLLEGGVIGWYIASALSTIWKLPAWRYVGSAVVLVFAMGVLLPAYHFVVFVVTLLSTVAG